MIGRAAATPFLILFTVDQVEIHGRCVLAASDAARKVTAGDQNILVRSCSRLEILCSCRKGSSGFSKSEPRTDMILASAIDCCEIIKMQWP